LVGVEKKRTGAGCRGGGAHHRGGGNNSQNRCGNIKGKKGLKKKGNVKPGGKKVTELGPAVEGWGGGQTLCFGQKTPPCVHMAQKPEVGGGVYPRLGVPGVVVFWKKEKKKHSTSQREKPRCGAGHWRGGLALVEKKSCWGGIKTNPGKALGGGPLKRGGEEKKHGGQRKPQSKVDRKGLEKGGVATRKAFG